MRRRRRRRELDCAEWSETMIGPYSRNNPDGESLLQL